MRKQLLNNPPHKAIFHILFIIIVALLVGCDSGNTSGKAGKPTYVAPSIDKRGRFRKGHIRMPVSTDKNAFKNRNRSRYYYHTRGKYRRK
jgi:hypothetical protein